MNDHYEGEAEIERAWREGLTPNVLLSVSEWSDRYRVLSRKASAEPGRWRTSRTPYLKEIMDCLSPGSPAERVVFMKSVQMSATELGTNWIGYVIHHVQGPMMAVWPTVDMAKRNSKQRIDPLIEESGVLAELIAPARSRDSGNTILMKEFRNGVLVMTGANSAVGLRSMPVQYLFLDEVDGYPPDVDGEGDPISLVEARTDTFAHRKIFIVSTPTIAGASAIEREYQESDQRRFYVPCPHCGHAHVLKWENISIADERPETAMLRCPECGALIEDKHKGAMLEAGKWIAENPEGRYPGFHLSGLYSPWTTFAKLAEKYFAAKGNPEKEKTWWNTSMGEPFAAPGVSVEPHTLMEKCQSYDAQTLPAGVICVTAGVDVQGDRLELEFVGWGAGAESWGIYPQILRGNTGEAEIWTLLDDVLARARFTTEDGRVLRVIGVCVDSGYETQNVYEFCTPRAARNIWATKGQEGQRPVWPRKVTRSRKFRGHQVRLVGVDSAKETIYSRFAIEDGKPGCCHFSMAYDEDWFTQATVETMVTSIDTRGRETRKWVKPRGARNEALDCRVYAYAAMVGLKVERGLALWVTGDRRRETEELPAASPPLESPSPVSRFLSPDPPPPQPKRPALRKMQSRYLGRR
jgi:phage terminase large subunit GpA-like protein